MKKKQQAKALVRTKNEEKEKKKYAYLKASLEISQLAESKWSGPQLKAHINYKRWKTDSWQQPKTGADLLNKWAEIMDPETPPPSPVQDEGDSSDKENNIDVEPV